MCQRKKDQKGKGIWVGEEGLGSIGEKNQAEGQSRYIALHLLMPMYDPSDNKIIGLFSLRKWGLVGCLIIIHVMVMETKNR